MKTESEMGACWCSRSSLPARAPGGGGGHRRWRCGLVSERGDLGATWLLVVALTAMLHRPALAHVESGTATGLASGFSHPITGLDHLAAMVAVGLWGAQLGSPAIWLLPITFPLVIALGGLLGLARLSLPFTEQAGALSAVVLGALILLRARPALWIAPLVVSAFAIFPRYGPRLELPNPADSLASRL